MFISSSVSLVKKSPQGSLSITFLSEEPVPRFTVDWDENLLVQISLNNQLMELMMSIEL